MNKKILIAFVIGLVLSLVGIGYLFLRDSAVLGGPQGGIAQYQSYSFLQGLFGGQANQLKVTNTGAFIEGGNTITSAVSSTLTAAQVCNLALYTSAGSAAATVITLPTAAALHANCLTSNGAFMRFFVFNNSTNTVTFATSTGDTIAKSFNSSGTASISANTGANPWGSMVVIRVNSTTDNYLLSQFQLGL